MRPSSFVVLAMLLAPCATAAATQDAARPIPTRQTRFSIPFHVDRSSWQAPPSEVRLYMRQAPAGTWRMVGRARPEQGSFDFSAPRDGAFAFSIRNVDERGLEYPGGPHVAELTVLVDTREPTLRVTATSDAAGDVTVQWRAGDVNLDPSSLSVEYRTDPRSAWRKVATGAAGRREGRTTWRTNLQRGEVELRAQVSDLAGNRAVWSGRVPLAAHAAVPLVDRTGALATARLGPFRPGSVGQVAPAADSSRQFSPDGTFVANPQRGDGSVPWSRSERDATRQRSGNASPLQHREQLPPATTVSHPNRWAPPPRPPVGDAAGWRSADDPRQQQDTPLPQRTRAVNAARLEIDYDDQRIARSGARAVQVWWTRDQGRTWQLLNTDRDIRSPAVVNVDGEGTFGFRVVALGARDVLGRPPRPGERPEMMLTVDLTRPLARITSARQTSSETLAIGWEASDARLAAQPISLSYSATPSGRRTSIARGIANTGHYQWRLDGRVPRQLYLHVEAKDAAGNIRHATSGEPVSLTLRQQQGGAVRDVRPLGTSASGPRRYQFY